MSIEHFARLRALTDEPIQATNANLARLLNSSPVKTRKKPKSLSSSKDKNKILIKLEFFWDNLLECVKHWGKMDLVKMKKSKFHLFKKERNSLY